MEGEDDREAQEKASMDTIYPHRNIVGGSIATCQAGESFLTPLPTAATGDLVQGILHVPVNIPVNDLMVAALKGGGISNQAVLQSLRDPTVVGALKDPRVVDALKDPRVLVALKDPKVLVALKDPRVLVALKDPRVLETLKVAEEMARLETLKVAEEERKEKLAQALITTVVQGFKESLDSSIDDAIHHALEDVPEEDKDSN